MVDFALVSQRESGLSAPAAIREAALVHLHPITPVAMGAVLAIGSAPARKRARHWGIAIFGGLLPSQLLTSLSTPAAYLWQQNRRERKAARKAARKARIMARNPRTCMVSSNSSKPG